ncbi:MAG: protein kinase [Polyangiaceae bacterium]
MDASTIRRARERIGSVLREKWHLDKLIGVGGMAAVYAATHRNKKRGAVKLMHAEVSANEDTRTRFLREGYVANHVDHPGAVSVLDDDVAEDGSVYLVMELLEGRNVEHTLRTRASGRFEVGEVLAIADAALDVLAAAHEKGIVHRDIKPDNLFITRAGQLKVLDFGIARVKKEAPSASDTATGVAIGTPMYMPPEQALGEWHRVDGRTDLWAIGASMFALLTGREVRSADNIQKLFLAAMTEPLDPIASVAPGLPPEVCALVDRAVAFRVEDRFASAREMQAAVRALRARWPGALSCDAEPAAPPPQHAVAITPMTPPRELGSTPSANYGAPMGGPVVVGAMTQPPMTTPLPRPVSAPVIPTMTVAAAPSSAGPPRGAMDTAAMPPGRAPMYPTPQPAVLAAASARPSRRSPVVPILLVLAALLGIGSGRLLRAEEAERRARGRVRAGGHGGAASGAGQVDRPPDIAPAPPPSASALITPAAPPSARTLRAPRPRPRPRLRSRRALPWDRRGSRRPPR